MAPTPNDFPRIYLFGDSLTERGFNESDCGFGWKLGQYYEDRVEVVNEGYSGETTRSLRQTFKDRVLGAAEKRGPPAPLFITIFLGANDACFDGRDTYVPIADYEGYIRNYVNSILDHPATKETKVILISPPPVDVPAPKEGSDDLMAIPSVVEAMRVAAATGFGHRTWESKRNFVKKIVEIGREFEAKTDRVAVLDFWTVITKFACQEAAEDDSVDVFHQLDLEDKLPGSGMVGAKEFGRSYFTDGLHFGKKGYEVLSQALMDLVLTKWPELKKENFPIRD